MRYIRSSFCAAAIVIITAVPATVSAENKTLPCKMPSARGGTKACGMPSGSGGTYGEPDDPTALYKNDGGAPVDKSPNGDNSASKDKAGSTGAYPPNEAGPASPKRPISKLPQ